MGKWFIDSGMRAGTPKADQENVIKVYGGTEPWKQHLGVKAKDSAYIVILDQKRNIADSFLQTGSVDIWRGTFRLAEEFSLHRSLPLTARASEELSAALR